MKALRAMPAMALAAVIALLAFAAALVRPGVGAVLQVREVLRVLQQHAKRPMDLETKAVFLASKIIELVGHPWFVGCQFHPEFKSKPDQAHPLFRDFIKASLANKSAA